MKKLLVLGGASLVGASAFAEGETTIPATVFNGIKDTVDANLPNLWTVAGALVGTLAVLWFARLGLRLIKSLASSAAS